MSSQNMTWTRSNLQLCVRTSSCRLASRGAVVVIRYSGEAKLELLGRLDLRSANLGLEGVGFFALRSSVFLGTRPTEVLGQPITIHTVLPLAGPVIENDVRVIPNPLQYVGADVLELIPGLRARQIGCR